MNSELKNYLPVVESVVTLLYPFVEGNVHDAHNKKLVASYNSFPNHDHKKLSHSPDPYFEQTEAGLKLKCITSEIKNSQQKIIGFVTFKFDATYFLNLEDVFQTFLGSKTDEDNSNNQYQETDIQKIIDEYLKTNNLNKDSLSRKQKKEIVKLLFDKGIFNLKNAPQSISQHLKISRASVYNYLK